MGIIEIILLSIGLGMDAFAVSVCKGISIKKMDYKKSIIIGLYFGAFQALMPVIGYFLGETFSEFISNIDHWIAFILLTIIGGKMIKDAISKEKENENYNDDISFKTMIVLAIATSIDALAVGITFAFFKVNVLLSVTLIGIITFILSVIGTKIGNRFGNKYEKNAELIGGTILILIGLKILCEHLGIIAF